MTPRCVLYDPSCTAVEKLLILAIIDHEWEPGRGCWPSNAVLIAACGFKADGPDKGSKALRKVLASLKSRGCIRVEAVPQTPINPTGREIYFISPTDREADAPGRTGPPPPGAQARGPRVYRPSPPGRTGPGSPGAQALPPPGAQALRIDSRSIDLSIDPSSAREDDELLRGLEQKVGQKLRSNPEGVARVVRVLPDLIDLARKRGADPAVVIGGCIANLDRFTRPKAEAGFLKACVENHLKEPKAAPSVPLPKPVVETIRERDKAAELTRAEDEARNALWDATPEPERKAIRKRIKGERPELNGIFLDAACKVAIGQERQAQAR